MAPAYKFTLAQQAVTQYKTMFAPLGQLTAAHKPGLRSHSRRAPKMFAAVTV